MSASSEFDRIIAKAYYEAALAKAGMREATDALEAVRSAIAEGRDYFDVWQEIDQQIGQTDDDQLRKILIKFHNRFEQRSLRNEIARLRGVFGDSAEAGWREWLQTYATALSYFRIPEFCLPLSEEGFSFPAGVESDVERISRMTRYADHERWPEAYDMFIFLGEQESILPVQRAEMYATAAEIQLYYFLDLETAHGLLKQADRIAPGDSRVLCVWGEYWLQKSEFGRAKECFGKVISQDPMSMQGYEGMGDVYERQNDFDSAEDWYKESVKKKMGTSWGYIRLLQLYGRPEMFAAHEAEIPPLLDRAVAVRPADKYYAYLCMGNVYSSNKLYRKAHRWYDKAVKLDETVLGGYTSKGQAYIDEGDYEKAQTALQKAIEVAPESFEGYSLMAYLQELREQWTDALYWHKQSLPRRPSWEGRIRGNIGQIEYRLEHYEEAKQDLLKALSGEPDNQTWLTALGDVADDYYMKLDNPDAALEIYAKIREIKGEQYEAEYQNRVGNLRYFRQEYQAAVNAYERAVASEPREAMYHSNLAGAFLGLEQWGNARKEIEKALELGLNESDYGHQMMLVCNGEGNEYFARADYLRAVQKYEEAIGFDPADPTVHMNLAGAHRELRNWKKATEATRKAFKLGLEEDQYRNQMMHISNREAIAHQELGNYRKAVEKYKEAIGFVPSDPVLHSNLTSAFIGLEEWENAKKEIERALELGVKQEDYRHHMMLITNGQGNEYFARADYQKAIEKYEEAIKFDSSDPTVHSNLASARAEMKKSERPISQDERAG